MIPFLRAIANVFRMRELRRRILLTLGLLTIYRLGSVILLPGVDHRAWEAFVAGTAGGILGLANLFTGSNLAHLTLLALGILPYAIACFVVQTIVQTSLSLKRVKQAEWSTLEIISLRRTVSIGLSIILSFFIAWTLRV